jgi:hypothetical protein
LSDQSDISTLAPAAATTGFFSSTAGRVLLVVGGVVVLLVICGVVAELVLGAALTGVTSSLLGGVAGRLATSQPAAAASTQSVTTGTATLATVPPVPDVGDRDVFLPRDPFAVIEPPTIASTTTSSTSTSTSSTTTTSTASSKDTSLILVDIVSDNGVAKAVFKYKGVEYTVGKGGTVDSSAWQVVSVGTSSVVMLYGDDRVILYLGEGISK